MNIKFPLLLFIFCILIQCNVIGQSVSVVNFKGLQPLLSTQTDSVYVVNFWATWCQPCVKELPAFYEAAQKLKGEKVKFIMVSLDFKKTIDSKLIPFLSKNKVPGQIILLDDPDSNNWIPKVDAEWDGAIPVTLIFNKEKSTFVNTSFENTQDLLNHINKLK